MNKLRKGGLVVRSAYQERHQPGAASVNAGSWFNVRPANRIVLHDNSQAMTFTSSNLSSSSSSFVPTQFQG